MLNFLSFLLKYTTLVLFLFIAQASAVDTVKMLRLSSDLDKRTLHKEEVIVRALSISEPEFGPYKFNPILGNMTPGRTLNSMREGELINTYIGPSRENMEEYAIPIKVPIRMGLLNYRLFLVNKSNMAKFDKVESLDDLNKLVAGLQNHWVTTDIFKNLDMNMVTGHNFDGMFLMLQKNRFDYFPRAIYEIYEELEERKLALDNITIEPRLALHLPMPTYVYVSKNAPQLAKRVEFGLRKMVNKGEIKRLLYKYYSEEIQKANLPKRTIIHMDNPYFLDKEVLEDSLLWIKH
ncbi:hypothetical protein [Paraglaciecola sp.]|uniref:hypothetical protein n=1 Tax=Paraglaciecola sp. TaxID=1920173 RepID=UPI003EFAF8D4